MVPRAYDPELDNITSVLSDLCAHLDDRRCLEFAVSIGDVRLPVDVWIDLCTLLEQAPGVIRSLGSGKDCNLDFYEQGPQTFLRFEFRSGLCLLSGMSYDRRISVDSVEVDPEAISQMLRSVVATFMAAATHASPADVQGVWMRDWLGADTDAIRDAEALAPAVFTKLDLVAAILSFLATQRPLFAYAHANFSMPSDLTWTPSGFATIDGTRWQYTKHGLGYRFENEQQVELDIDQILEYSSESIDAVRLSGYVESILVGHVVIERDEISVVDLDALDEALQRLVKTGLITQMTSVTFPEYRLEPHVDLSKAVALAQEMAREHFGKVLAAHAIEAVFRERLWGPREYWKCTEMGLVTRVEVANVLVARVDSDLIRTHDWSIEWNDSMGAAVVEELVRILPDYKKD